MPDNEKLAEILAMANGFNDRLRPELGKRYMGGCLVLGKYYGQSDRIFLGLNPGGEYSNWETKRRSDGYNPPFDNPPDADIRYWLNCERFLKDHQPLYTWFNDHVTSTFLVPWRTRRAGRDLKELNEMTGSHLYRFSGTLLLKMVEHHDAKMLLIVAKEGAHLLNELIAAANGQQAGPWTRNQIEPRRREAGRLTSGASFGGNVRTDAS